jgi:precorrin-6B methylase 2
VVNLDVAYIPTPKDIVRRMLQLASLRRGEHLFDLGAGDGRIIIEAVRDFGARAVGVEVDPERITRIRERLKSTGTQAELIQADLFEVNLSSADVITIYLSPSANAKLAPKLKAELKVGTRVVSLDYVLPDWVPDREVEINTSGMKRKLYLYRTT